MSENGVREITLLGQNVNAYNYENYRLSDLILEIEKLDGILKELDIQLLTKEI